MERNKEDKLQEREIAFKRVPKERPEKEHGKVYRWLDNFWYHHKWATIATLFIVVVLTVCVLQMCSREEEGDVKIVTAGPYGFFSDEATLTNLKNCLATYITADHNGNGVKDVTVFSYTVYSEQEATALESQVDENGEPLGFKVDRYQNTQEYAGFSQYLTTGNASVLFLSPWLAEEYAANGNVLMNVSDMLDAAPQNGVFVTREDGSTVCYGIKLGETALWRENSAVRAALPENTVICLMSPGLLGSTSDEEIYHHAVEFFKALIK